MAMAHEVIYLLLFIMLVRVKRGGTEVQQTYGVYITSCVGELERLGRHI
jgi:Uri superfamily endonuclease